MGQKAELSEPAPLRISRVFAAPRKTVFDAWSTAEHVKRWFAPAVYTAPDANVAMEVGGAFDVCMRAPDGTEHWTRGSFVEVTPYDRLVLDLRAVDGEGKALFTAWTEVNFADDPGGTRLDVTQTYVFADPALAAGMVAGAPMGWSQSLDKLEAEVARMLG